MRFFPCVLLSECAFFPCAYIHMRFFPVRFFPMCFFPVRFFPVTLSNYDKKDQCKGGSTRYVFYYLLVCAVLKRCKSWASTRHLVRTWMTWLAQLSVILPWRRYYFWQCCLQVFSQKIKDVNVLLINFFTTVSLFAFTSISLYFSINFSYAVLILSLSQYSFDLMCQRQGKLWYNSIKSVRNSREQFLSLAMCHVFTRIE